MSKLIGTKILESSTLMERLIKEKKIARSFQERRHADWDENYELYRNKVRTNRLTQRQAVNIPLMKETVKTLISKIDEPPMIDWEEKEGDEAKEINVQSLWDNDFERLNFEAIDIQDKKTVLLCGRSFKKLNWQDGMDVRALDIYDVVVDPLMDPLDIETARFVIHQNIFRTIREILADPRYTKKGKEELKKWMSTQAGMVQSESNKKEWDKKIERLKAMGVNHADFPNFAGGDVVVNLTEHHTRIWSVKSKKYERRVIVYANDEVELMNTTLKSLMGVEFYPFVTWGDDIETNDIWSDGPADLVRVPNKVVNIYFSQLVENRTLRNFQMHWYDATNSDYKPQTYEPGAGRMLPAPGNPKETIMPVDIQGLDETLTAIDFVIKLVERGTAATSIEKGVGEKKQTTLGEVEHLIGKATERTVAMSKFYRRSWQELAMKWERIMDANERKATTLYKKSRNGRLWPKKIYPGEWRSKAGYKAIARSSSEQEVEQVKGIQKFEFLLKQFPNNPALRKIAQRRSLEIVDLTPEEIREVQEAEDQLIQQPPGTDERAGENQQIEQSIEENLNTLSQLNAR